MRIGMLTFHWADNYGAVLQTYALSRYIKENITPNDSVEVVNFENRENSKIYRLFVFSNNSIKERVKGILRGVKNYPVWQKKRKGYENFRNRIPISRKYTRTQLLNSETDYDVWITGSDQVWNTDIVGSDYEIYDLSFIKRKQKSSYAASSGPLDNSNPQHIRLVKDIGTLDNISVRESSTQEYLSGIISKPVKRVVDPTFLLSREDWEVIVPKKRIHNNKYLFLYYIAYDRELALAAELIAKKIGLDIVVCGTCPQLKNKSVTYKSASPEEFLNLIKNADYVIASSFHAIVFATIFKKRFMAFIPPYASNRVMDLCKLIGLENRLFSQASEIESVFETPIDYAEVDVKLMSEKEKSIEYLQSVIGK